MLAAYERRLVLFYLSNTASRLHYRSEGARKLVQWLGENEEELELQHPLTRRVENTEERVGQRGSSVSVGFGRSHVRTSPILVGTANVQLDCTQNARERMNMKRGTTIPLAHRKVGSGSFTVEESDHAARVARIITLAERTFGDQDKARRWPHKNLVSLDDRRPIDLTRTAAGTRLVEVVLVKIAWGAAA